MAALLTSHMDAMSLGLEGLEATRMALRALQQRLSRISGLCMDCQALNDHQEGQIRQVSMVHCNLRQTLLDVEAVAALPEEASHAEELLRREGPAGLVQAYVQLSTLEGTATKAYSTLCSINAGQTCDDSSLATYFVRVQQGLSALEERLWSTIRAYRVLAHHNPAPLVAALQVIELQEMVDDRLYEGAASLRKGWRKRCLHHAASTIQEDFAPLLQRCSHLHSCADVGATVADILQTANTFVVQLANMVQHVVPCFPPHYKILDFFCTTYNAHITSVIDLLGVCAQKLSNADILATMAWIQQYGGKLAGLGFSAGPAVSTGEFLLAVHCRHAARW